LLYLIPIALVTRYQITQAVHASIRAELDRRRKAEP
jgi:Na+/melibiose symporter-like transporter